MVSKTMESKLQKNIKKFRFIFESPPSLRQAISFFFFIKISVKLALCLFQSVTFFQLTLNLEMVISSKLTCLQCRVNRLAVQSFHISTEAYVMKAISSKLE